MHHRFPFRVGGSSVHAQWGSRRRCALCLTRVQGPPSQISRKKTDILAEILPDCLPYTRIGNLLEIPPQILLAPLLQALSKTMPQILPEAIPQILPETLPEILPEFLPEILPEFMPKFVPEFEFVPEFCVPEFCARIICSFSKCF